MSVILMGLETEYALSGVGDGVDGMQLAQAFMQATREAHPTLPDGGSGVFLPNGARLYFDTGLHPEYATPECTDPWDLVAHAGAGDRLMSRLAGRLVGRVPGLREARLFRGNVDYSGSGATWGCHESYLYRSASDDVLDQVLPHLVSRIVYAGAGGFDPCSPGLRFILSPRSRFLSQEMSPNTLQQRGIVCTRDDPMCEGYRRLHLICGESLCSEAANLLKVGTTALVVAMASEGLRPGEAVKLALPVPALWAFATDPGCTASVPLARGGCASAVLIQRHYLEQAETCCEEGLFPAWGAQICALWRRVLEVLERDPETLSPTLDWTAKRAVYGAHLPGDLGWEALSDWTQVLELVRVVAPWPIAPGMPPPLEGARAWAEPLLATRGLGWGGLVPFLHLRDELLELDLRFGQLGGDGIFDQLDARRVLRHRVLEPARFERASREPPTATRARPRGELVQRLGALPGAAAEGRYRCDWNCVSDSVECRHADLSDPFATEARWVDDAA